MDSIMLIFAVFLLGVLYTPDTVSATDCIEPANLTEIRRQLDDELQDTYMHSMSFFNIRNILNEASDKLMMTSHETSADRVFVSKIHGDSRCRKRHLLGPGRKEENERSSCPWYYVMEVDFNREPQTIVKAKCSCRKCLEPAFRGNSDRSLKSSCKEVSYQMPVIRRTCAENGGIYQYGINLEDVSVGCTCQRSMKVKRKD